MNKKVEIKLQKLLASVAGEFPHVKTTRGKLRYRRYIRLINRHMPI